MTDRLFCRGMERFMLENRDAGKKIVDKGLMAGRGRMGGKKGGEVRGGKSGLEI